MVSFAPPPVKEKKSQTQVKCMSTKSPVKIKWEEDINNTVKESRYSYSSQWAVEEIVLTRILDHLMLQIAIADGWMNWYKYPPNWKSIRKKQPKTLDSKICPTYPAMRSRTLAAFRCSREYLFNFLERPKVLIQWNRPNPFQYVLHRVLWLVHICESKCMVSVILLSPTAHNDSDSDIASLAGWLRLGSHGTHWQPGRAGPGGLNLKPRFAKPRIMAGAGVLPAQRWTGRPTSARRRCATLNLNLVDIYHMIHPLVSTLVA